MEYDEEAILTRYIWENYSRLFTRLERIGAKAVMAQAKARGVDPQMADMLRQRWGGDNDPQIVAAFSEGPDVFRLRVRDRVLLHSKDEVVINRCPECRRIVRTPRARQCLWCGHDWH